MASLSQYPIGANRISCATRQRHFIGGHLSSFLWGQVQGCPEAALESSFLASMDGGPGARSPFLQVTSMSDPTFRVLHHRAIVPFPNPYRACPSASLLAAYWGCHGVQEGLLPVPFG